MQGEELLAVQHAVLTATRSASALPGPADLQYHRALDKGFAHGLDASSILILRLVNQLLVYSSSKSCPLDAAAIADDYAEIISLTDGVLERVVRCTFLVAARNIRAMTGPRTRSLSRQITGAGGA